MAYIDGLVFAVPTARKAEFIEYGRRGAEVFKRHGALDVVDCWGDDVPDGEMTSMLKAVKCGPDETVVFAWVLWPSKEVREAQFEAALVDPEMGAGADQMPFDGKRMIFGGFEMVVGNGA